jgi:hypothetical protein
MGGLVVHVFALALLGVSYLSGASLLLASWGHSGASRRMRFRGWYLTKSQKERPERDPGQVLELELDVLLRRRFFCFCFMLYLFIYSLLQAGDGIRLCPPHISFGVVLVNHEGDPRKARIIIASHISTYIARLVPPLKLASLTGGKFKAK